eukprot:Skav218204  [mRNA]  locus=scaffold2232:132750:148216:+ [translate_table: standard]
MATKLQDSPTCAAREFALDSVYKVVPWPRREAAAGGGDTAVLEGDLPDMAVIYASQLDCRPGVRVEALLEQWFLSVDSSCAAFSESHFGSQSHCDAFRGGLQRSQVAEWLTGQVRISSEPKLTVDLKRFWLYLRHFPGLRDNEAYLDAMGHWFPETCEAQMPCGVWQTTWMLTFPLLRLPLGAGLPTRQQGTRAQPKAPGEQPVLLVNNLEVQRLGDLQRNWAKALAGLRSRGRVVVDGGGLGIKRKKNVREAGCVAAPRGRRRLRGTMAAQSLRDTIKEKIATALKENLKMDEREFTNPWSTQAGRAHAEWQGEKFTPQEPVLGFAGVSSTPLEPPPRGPVGRIRQADEAQCTRLRRMVYLVIKELEPSDQEATMPELGYDLQLWAWVGWPVH